MEVRMHTRLATVGWIVATMVVLAGATTGLAGTVVINEVAWSGTAASASDEWIELYNTAGEAIDLAGWTVVFGETTIHLGVAEGSTREVRRATVEAGGYFLLERTDDATLADVEADVVYAGALSNNGTPIELRDASGQVVDRVEIGEGGWPAGTDGNGDPAFATMERADPLAPPDWATNDGQIRNGTGADGSPVNGTPGAENSARIIALRAPRVELLAPHDDGATLSGIVIVVWSATDPDGPAGSLRVSIELSSDGGATWEAVATDLANGGSYAWDTAAHPDRDGALLRVVAEDASGYRGADVSPTFTIRNAKG